MAIINLFTAHSASSNIGRQNLKSTGYKVDPHAVGVEDILHLSQHVI